MSAVKILFIFKSQIKTWTSSRGHVSRRAAIFNYVTHGYSWSILPCYQAWPLYY